MRPAASLLQLALCLSTAAPLVAAWPGWLPNVDALVVRDGENTASETSGASPTQTSAPPSQTASASPSPSGSNSAQTTNPNTANLNTAKPKTGSQTASPTATGTISGVSVVVSGNSTHTQYPADSPAASVVVQTPATTAGTALYVIGDYVTWGWNYTNLLGTPTAIDVLVSCSTASQTWTLTSNMTFQTAVSYVWDTQEQADSVSTPLLTAMYTLIVKDSDASISDTPESGYLGTFSGLTFGLYTLLPYTPYAEWTCSGCSAASSNFDHHALGFAVTMCVVTVLSFTWFVSGLGLQ